MSGAGVFAAPPSISTKAELDRLVEERSRPAAEMHLRPEGPIVGEVAEKLNRLRETRIADLTDRLQAAREGLEWGQAAAQLQDRASTDFERSR